MGDNHLLGKGCPPHVRVSKGFRHQPLVWFYGFETVTHVPACPDDQLGKVASMGHYKYIRLQADQEIKCGQASHMLPEVIQLLLSCQLLLGYLLQTLIMSISMKWEKRIQREAASVYPLIFNFQRIIW